MAWQNGTSTAAAYDTFDTRPPDSVDAGAASGSGGNDLQLWDKTVEEKYDFVSSKEIQYWSDESSYGIFSSPAWLHPTWGKHDAKDVKWASYQTSGTALDVDGSDLSGYVKLLTPDGDTVDTQSVTGRFIAPHGPPQGVESGPDIDLSGDYEVKFIPDVDGIPVVRTLTGLVTDMGEFQYSDITGQIRDSEGNPVENVAVTSEGQRTVSDARGVYTLLGPGGTAPTLTSLDGEFSKDVSLVAGETNQIDWQYAGIYIDISLPGGISAVGVPVELTHNGNLLYTGEDGQVKFTKVPPEVGGDYEMFGGEVTRSITSGSEGFKSNPSVDIGVGVRGAVTSADTGQRVEGATVKIEADGQYSSETADQGKYATGTAEVGTVYLVVAENSDRYETYREALDVSDGDLVERDIDLDEQVTTGTY